MRILKAIACICLACSCLTIGRISLDIRPCWVHGHGLIFQTRADRIREYQYNHLGSLPPWATLNEVRVYSIKTQERD